MIDTTGVLGRRMTALAALAAVAVLCAAWVVMLAPSAGAQDTSPAPAPGGTGKARTAVVMDASSSMLEPDEDGTRLDVAKRAATSLVDSLPDDAEVGMLAYGAGESDAPDNREAGCRDIHTLAPVGRIDKTRLRGEIGGLTARGYTPIGNSLRAAAEELGPDGQRSIVLVSDGIDTCAPPDPCEVAKELTKDGIGLAVHVVGFKVDEAARAQLQCIADSTGGTYAAAEDAASLTESLDQLTRRALNPYESFGTAFDFAPAAADGKYLGEGLYRTKATAHRGTGGTAVDEAPEQFFKVAVPQGHVARIVVTPLPKIDESSTSGGDGLWFKSSTHYLGSDCEADENDMFQSSQGGGFAVQQSAQVSIDPADNEGCDMSQWAVGTQIALDYNARGGDQDVEVEVSVQFEPADTDVADMPAGDIGHGTSNADTPNLPIDAPKPVSGAYGFNGATHIEPGAYSDAMVPGETKFYSFDVDWGQTPHVTVASGPSASESADRMNFVVLSPLRAEVADGNLSFFDDPRTESSIVVDRPINYRNREANLGGQARANAGTFYLAVSMNIPSTSDSRGIDQPFEFALAVDGQTAPGPDWRPSTKPGPEPSDTPPGTEAASSAAAAPTSGAQFGDTESTAAQGSTDDGRPAWMLPAIGGGGAIVLLALLAIAVAVLRRK